MMQATPFRLGLIGFVLATACAASAQQLIGYVSTSDAQVAGASDVLDGRAVLTGSASITAKDHTAPITLSRGGTVRVCQTSMLHVTESRAVEIAAPLLFSLERGAIEIQMVGTPSDAIMTPDLRLTVRNSGPLDLRLRVAGNGDTCVENRGVGAPTIAISDPFGDSMYEVSPNQHVLFEHGSLHEVVDRETSPCGCPEPKAGVSVADALLAPSPASTPAAAAIPKAPAPAAAVAPAAPVEHPFPAAISEGLAPPEEVPPAPPGPHPPVTDALVYMAPPVARDPDELGPTPPAPKPVLAPAVPPTAAPAPPPVLAASPVPPPPAPPAPAQSSAAPAPPVNDVVHIVGRLFHKLFGRH